jgi:hypothetical protein
MIRTEWYNFTAIIGSDPMWVYVCDQLILSSKQAGIVALGVHPTIVVETY